MEHKAIIKSTAAAGVLSLLALLTSVFAFHADSVQPVVAAPQTASYIIQADSLETAVELVRQVGGKVSDELGIIRAVGAVLTPRQVEMLRAHGGRVKVFEDGKVSVSSTNVPETYFPALIGATDLHGAGIDGRGVTIAVLDTGLWTNKKAIRENAAGEQRVLAQYDVILDGIDPEYYPLNGYDDDIGDWSGHGTHISSVMASSGVTRTGLYQGVAPGADIVAVRAFAADGSGKYIDVIKAIGWIVLHRNEYGIRVLNLSFSGTPLSYYWEDPLNQAVMAAW